MSCHPPRSSGPDSKGAVDSYYKPRVYADPAVMLYVVEIMRMTLNTSTRRRLSQLAAGGLRHGVLLHVQPLGRLRLCAWQLFLRPSLSPSRWPPCLCSHSVRTGEPDLGRRSDPLSPTSPSRETAQPESAPPRHGHFGFVAWLRRIIHCCYRRIVLGPPRATISLWRPVVPSSSAGSLRLASEARLLTTTRTARKPRSRENHRVVPSPEQQLEDMYYRPPRPPPQRAHTRAHPGRAARPS